MTDFDSKADPMVRSDPFVAADEDGELYRDDAGVVGLDELAPPLAPPLVSPQALAEDYSLYQAIAASQQPWRALMVDAMALRAQENALDMGCSGGDLTLDLHAAAPKDVAITGLEADPQWLKYAQSRSNAVAWRFGDIADGMFENAQFDAISCAFSLGRFTDPEDALAACRLALRSKGRLIVAAWSAGPEDSVRRTLLEIFSRHTPPEVTRAYAAQFSLGASKELGGAANAAGFGEIMLQKRRETVRFDSLEQFIDTEIAAIPLADRVNPVHRAGMLAEARNKLHRRIKRDGRFIAPLDAVLLSARRL